MGTYKRGEGHGAEAAFLTQEMMLAGFGYPRVKGNETDLVLGEMGEPDKGEGVRVTLQSHYLLIEAETSDDTGEFWIPITTLLELIGKLHERVAN